MNAYMGLTGRKKAFEAFRGIPGAIRIPGRGKRGVIKTIGPIGTQPKGNEQMTEIKDYSLFPDERLSRFVNAVTLPGLAADFIAPNIEVPRQTGYFGGIERESLTYADITRAQAAQPRMIGWSPTSVFFNCVNYDIAYKLPIELDVNADKNWNTAENTARFLVSIHQGAREIAVRDAVTTATNVATLFTVGSALSAGGDPISVLCKAIVQMQNVGGYRPNQCVIGAKSWQSVQVNSATRASLGGHVTPDRLGDFLRLNVVVAEAFHFSGNSPVFVWDDLIHLCYQPGDNSELSPRFAATAFWRPLGADASIPGRFVALTHPYDTREKSWTIEVLDYSAIAILDPKLGVTILGCNSSQSGGI
jgi:hypothetical protein